MHFIPSKCWISALTQIFQYKYIKMNFERLAFILFRPQNRFPQHQRFNSTPAVMQAPPYEHRAETKTRLTRWGMTWTQWPGSFATSRPETPKPHQPRPYKRGKKIAGISNQHHRNKCGVCKCTFQSHPTRQVQIAPTVRVWNIDTLSPGQAWSGHLWPLSPLTFRGGQQRSGVSGLASVSDGEAASVPLSLQSNLKPKWHKLYVQIIPKSGKKFSDILAIFTPSPNYCHINICQRIFFVCVSKGLTASGAHEEMEIILLPIINKTK